MRNPQFYVSCKSPVHYLLTYWKVSYLVNYLFRFKLSENMAKSLGMRHLCVTFLLLQVIGLMANPNKPIKCRFRIYQRHWLLISVSYTDGPAPLNAGPYAIMRVPMKFLIFVFNGDKNCCMRILSRRFHLKWRQCKISWHLNASVSIVWDDRIPWYWNCSL